MSGLRNMLCALLALGLSACAGTNFVRPGPESLKNGVTTYAQVIEKMGLPRNEGTMMRNDTEIKTASYAYASAGGAPHHEGITPARAMGVYFVNGTLVGHEFISSWAADHTDFDENRVKDIVKGKTTRAEVAQMFGQPGGYHAYPLIKDKSAEAAVYAYVEVRGFTPSRKLLVVTFDARGIVSDVTFSKSGRAEN